MGRLPQRVLIVLALMVMLLGTFHYAQAQRMRTPRVYNPRTYSGTRRQMSNRAAARAASKRRLKTTHRRRSSRLRHR